MRYLVPGCVALLATALVLAPLAFAKEPAVIDRPDPWPREVTAADGDRLVIHQPQVDRWADDALEARAAVALHLAGDEDATFGALWVRGDTRTNLDTRVVTVANVRIEEARFPSTGRRSQAEVLERLRAMFPRGPVDISLDRLLANIERTQTQAALPDAELGPVVPRVLVTHRAARLILIDGEPLLHAIADTRLMHVVNTKWHILLESGTGTYFLRLGDGWVMADALTGRTWRRAPRAPQDLARISDKHPRAQAKDTLVDPRAPVPEIHVSTEPAELVVIDGNARLSPIRGTSLLYVINTQNDVFLHVRESRYYVLASGRWYRAPRLAGPWAEVTGALPEDFSRIPREHTTSGVLASVPGTPQAEEAVLIAQIPRRSVIRRSEARLTVVYDGMPRFERCAGSTVAYAVNSAYDVVLVGARYYCCHQGIWFVATAALGPWVVCGEVPAAIYTIGPRCPVYRVTYVRVYDVTPDLVVVGYLPGYLGMYVCPRRRVVVFGTGWTYRPWIRAGVWFGWPLTFGVGVVYHPYVSGFVLGVSYYTPYVVRPLRSTWYPYTVGFHLRYRTTNAYARWGPGVIHGHATWLRRQHVVGARGTLTGFGTRRAAATRRPRPSPVVRPARTTTRGDLYVGRDGRVYRRSTSGWQRRDGRTWRTVPAPRAVPRTTQPRTTRPRTTQPRTRLPSGLERDARSRRIGSERERHYDRWRRSAPSIRQPVRPSPPRRVTPPRRPKQTQPRAPRSGGSGRRR